MAAWVTSFTELLYYLVVNVSFKKGLSDVSHSIRDVGFGDSATAGKGFED
jgi:hypothetical protein